VSHRAARPERIPGALLFRLLLVVLVVAHPLPVVAQVIAQEETPSSIQQPTVLHWWHGAIAAGGLSALMLLDGPSQRFFQGRRSTGGDDFARMIRRGGQPEVYGTITLGVVAAGLISGDANLTRAGGRLAATLALAGATSTLAKLALGRPRPSESLDADGYVPFSGQDAMPSGHTTMAFALATALADDIHRPWATVGLYTLASGVGWSRINDNRHWLSDVVGGAVVGITSAKLVNGHWRIFGLRPPGVLLGPGHAGLAWRVEF
jgi:membrane-associated phospholipid phosphatase